MRCKCLFYTAVLAAALMLTQFQMVSGMGSRPKPAPPSPPPPAETDPVFSVSPAKNFTDAHLNSPAFKLDQTDVDKVKALDAGGGTQPPPPSPVSTFPVSDTLPKSASDGSYVEGSVYVNSVSSGTCVYRCWYDAGYKSCGWALFSSTANAWSKECFPGNSIGTGPTLTMSAGSLNGVVDVYDLLVDYSAVFKNNIRFNLYSQYSGTTARLYYLKVSDDPDSDSSTWDYTVRPVRVTEPYSGWVPVEMPMGYGAICFIYNESPSSGNYVLSISSFLGGNPPASGSGDFITIGKIYLTPGVYTFVLDSFDKMNNYAVSDRAPIHIIFGGSASAAYNGSSGEISSRVIYDPDVPSS